MSFPSLPPIPAVPDLSTVAGPIIDFGKEVVDRVESGVSKTVNKAAGIGQKVLDAAGVGGVTEKIGESINRIRSFANEQVDALLNGAASAARATEEFARETLEGARTKVDSTVDSALETARETVKEIQAIPGKASELLDDGARIKQRALERRDSLKKHKQRFKERKAKIPKVVGQHLEEIFVELDEELELEAAEAEKLGNKAEQDSRQLYNKTVEDAKHFGGILLKQTDQNRTRAKNLKKDLRDGKTAAKNWAADQAKKVGRFKSDRLRAAKSIGSPASAKAWATESIEGAHKLASEIKDDVARKPGEIKSFGQKRVEDAMELAQGIKQEVQTAANWAKTQKGNNAAWKRAMQENRNVAETFLKGQAARVAMRIEHHGAAVGGVAKDLTEEQLADTAKEAGKTVEDAKKSFQEVKGTILSDKDEIAESLGEGKPFDDTERGESARGKIQVDFADPEAEHPGDSMQEPETQLELPAKGASKPPSQTPPATKPDAKKQADSGKPPLEKEHGAAKQDKKPKSHEVQPVHDLERPASFETTKPGSPKPKSAGGLDVEFESSSKEPAPSSPVPIPYPNTSTKGKEKEHLPNVDSKWDAGRSVTPIKPPPKAMSKESGAQVPTEKPVAGSKPGAAKPETPSKPQSPSVGGAAKSAPRGKSPVPTQAAEANAPSSPDAAKAKLPGSSEKPPTRKDARLTTPQRKETPGSQPEDPKEFQSKLLKVGGEGDAPDTVVRSQISKHTGFDPTMVRFHTGSSAQAAAQALGADAFTIGRDIFFAPGKYDPRSPQGLGLIGHEVTHVGQQLGLRGNKMQFATKTGGDAMEQEAQAVGERIASNLSFGIGLRVGRYIRTYEPADDEPVTTALQVRLDRLSMQALTRASRFIAARPKSKPIQIDEVTLDLTLDMETLSDSEIVDIWADAIFSAVDAARERPQSVVETTDSVSTSTHILQKRLGDPTQAPTQDLPPPDPEMMAKMAKVTASAADKDIIRKLLVRKEVDELITRSKSRQRQEEYENQGGGDVKRMPHYSGQIHSDDKAAIEAKLKSFDINSYEDFEKLKKDFVSMFNTKGVNITHHLLDENLKIVLKEKPRYLNQQGSGENKDMKEMRDAAKEIYAKQSTFIDEYNNELIKYSAELQKKFGAKNEGPSHFATPFTLDHVGDELVTENKWLSKEAAERLTKSWQEWAKVRTQHGNKFPVLLGRNFNMKEVIDKKGDDLMMHMFEHIEKTEKNIKYAKSNLNADKFWELQPMIAITKSQLGVRKGEGAEKTLDEAIQGKANDATFWGILEAAAAIALAITATVATGGLAAVAMIGSAGLSLSSAARAADSYMFKSAAAGSSLDNAQLISKDEPSLLWLAIELVGAGLDLGAAVGAFKTLSKIAKTAVADRAALKQLEDTAREAYRATSGLKVSEEEFVKRLVETAKKGVKGAEGAAKQFQLITELIEGTSPLAKAILAKNDTAIATLLKEHGNWRGLMGALGEGGPEAKQMMQNLHEFREGVIKDLKSRGASPLDDASTEPLSDYDLNVKADDKAGAGEKVLAFEKEMSVRFGDNWSGALNLNFYTDKSQLLTVEKAMKLVSPQKQKAILERVTKEAAELNLAKMLKHAGDDAAAIAEVKDLAKAAGVEFSDVQKMFDKMGTMDRATLLKEIDADVRALEALPPGDSVGRAAKAEEITMKQMRANYLSTEAYIGPAAVKGGPLTGAEAYQSALSQLEMMKHVLHDCGGDIVKACREYEFFKYVNRYVAAAQKAGVKSAGLTYFDGLSSYIYKRARAAHQETGYLPGLTPADEALEAAATEKFLLSQYEQFRQEVQKTLPQIKASADNTPAGAWKPEAAKAPKPNSGLPPEPPKPKTPTSGGPNPNAKPEFTPPPGGSAATLPAASAKAAEQADKMMAGKSKPVDSKGGPLTPVESAGFKGSKTGEGLGVFRGNIPGVPNPVLITVLAEDDKAKFEMQLSAAIAAQNSGFGAKVHGKVDMGPKKLAFAMDEVKGGFADDFKRDDDLVKQGKNRQDMMDNAKYISQTTFVDVDGFREGIWNNGFYFVGHIEGFVGPDGHWKPVGYYNASPIGADTDQELARKNHDENFDRLRALLMQNHLKAMRENAPKP